MASESFNLSNYLTNKYLYQKPIPLWSPKGTYLENGQEFFDVEIFSDESSTGREKEIGDILNINMLRCHICDIDVPNSHINEHIKSVKHETYLKIANVALARTQNHLKSGLIDNKYKIEIKDTYYCDVCSIVVQDVDKDDHNNSKKHLKFVQDDALLQHLAKIYENSQRNFDENIVNHVNNVEEQQNNLLKTLKINCESKVNNDAKLPELSKRIDDSDTKGVKNITADIKNDSSKLDSNKHKEVGASNIVIDKHTRSLKEQEDEKNYTETNAITYPETELQNKPEEDKINTKKSKIQPSTSKTEKVLDNLKDKSLGAVCTYVEKFEDTKSYLDIAKFIHKDSIVTVIAVSEDTIELVAPQVERVKVPLMNFHGYHVIGKEVVCKICLDIKSEDGKKHKWTDVHMEKIISPIKKGHVRQIDETLRHCVLCNIVIQSSNTKEHTTTKEHKINLQKYLVVNKKTVTQKIAQLAVANCIKWTQDTMFCRICKMDIEKSNDSVNNHVQSKCHMSKFNCSLNVNNIVKSKTLNGAYYCIGCQQNVWPIRLMAHWSNASHKSKLVSRV